jgi:hypothetical protein
MIKTFLQFLLHSSMVLAFMAGSPATAQNQPAQPAPQAQNRPEHLSTSSRVPS